MPTWLLAVLIAYIHFFYNHGRGEGPRKFVEYNYDEILLENIKQACTQHFKEKRNCDVLASEQGPTCTPLDQLPSLNLIFIRFTTPVSIKNNDSASESWTVPPPM